MSTASITAQEQLMLELVNRARLDPNGEAARYGISLNEGLSSGTISSAPKAPLAFNFDLNESSANHSTWMLDNDTFSHTGAGGSDPGDRMIDAGYSFTGYWSWGENLSWRGSTGTLDVTASIYEQHKSLFLSEGHRVNTMGDFREMGIAQEIGGYTSGGTIFNASMITQNFAKTGTAAFITGVAFTDNDGDKFYDVGEGKSGIVIDWLGNSGGSTTTAAPGGYRVSIPTGLSGTASVSVDVGATTMNAILGMTGTNVKLDVINGKVLAASTDLTLGSNAKDGRLLGIASYDLSGNAVGNTLDGNKGANTIKGQDGWDYIYAKEGNDVIIGGNGRDTMTGGPGSDDFVFSATSHSVPGSESRDIIKDFARGSDDLKVSDIDANWQVSGNQAFALDSNGSFSAGEIRQKVSGGVLLVEFNTDSDSSAEMVIQLQGLTSVLVATDFIL